MIGLTGAIYCVQFQIPAQSLILAKYRGGVIVPLRLINACNIDWSHRDSALRALECYARWKLTARW